jgi:hypothetical protein
LSQTGRPGRETGGYTGLMRVLVFLLLAGAGTAPAQKPCAPTPVYSPCEITMELGDAAAAAHPNPWATVEITAEIRSPQYKTYKAMAFWDGGRRMVVRFAPDEPGDWTFRLTSNVAEFNGKVDKFTATASDAPGFIRRANVHHWQYTEGFKPHLWMGDTCYRCAWIDRTFFDQVVAKRAEQKFNHIRLLLVGGGEDVKKAFPTEAGPDPAYFQELDRRVAAMNAKGIVADLILGPDNNQLAALFPARDALRRYARYVVSRYMAYNVTWQMVQEYEEYKDARAFVKELGGAVKEFDSYGHPRSTHTLASSAALVSDGWMDYITYQSSDDALGSIERQLYGLPQVNAEFAYEDSGAGRSHDHHVDSETFRHRLWNATVDGEYPTFGNTGTYGGAKVPQDAKWLDSPAAKAMTAWFTFFSRTRHWELEPYYDLDGGRALALPGIEYIVYIEKPGPVQVNVERHSYDVYWFNPSTGELIKEKKSWKGSVPKEDEKQRQADEKKKKQSRKKEPEPTPLDTDEDEETPVMVTFDGAPPDSLHDWVLHLSRDGKKEGMLRSYKFESRRVPQQEPEVSPLRLPFDVVEPKSDVTLVVGQPTSYQIKLKRESPGTRRMMYAWWAEVPRDGEGLRYLAGGASGTFRIPPSILKQDTGTMRLRIGALNAFGKLYLSDEYLPVRRPDGTK